MKAPERSSRPPVESPITEAELGQLPRQLRIAFAARSALRVLPLLESSIDTWGKDANTNIQAMSALVYWPVIASLDFKFAASHSTDRLENAIKIAAGLVRESPAIECIATLGNAVCAAFLNGTDVEPRDLFSSSRQGLAAIKNIDGEILTGLLPVMLNEYESLKIQSRPSHAFFESFYKAPLWSELSHAIAAATKHWNQKINRLRCVWITKLYTEICSGKLNIDKIASVLENYPVVKTVATGQKTPPLQKGDPPAPQPTEDSVAVSEVPISSSKTIDGGDNILLSPSAPVTFIPPHSAAFIADDSSSVDHLGFSRYVEAFARLLSARETQMPLSVGLFGGWGTGKSSFMEQLFRRIEAIVNTPAVKKGTWTVDRVVQIRFNPWHSMDCDPWASLANGIFTGVAERQAGNNNDGSKNGVDEERRKLAVKLQSSRQCLERARGRRRALLDKRNRINVLHQGLDAVTRIHELLLKPGTLEKELFSGDNTLNQSTLKNLLKVTSYRKWAFLFPRILPVVGAYLFITLLVIYLPWANDLLSRIVAMSAALFLFVHPFLKYIRPLQKQITLHEERLKVLLGYASEDFNALLNEVSSTENISFSKGLPALADSCRQQIAALDHDIAETAAMITHLESGGLIYDFIHQYAGRPLYGDQPGLISTLRNDMRHLGKLLDDYQTGAERRQWRIVLYIDDLDQCPAQRVVEVLQAIHLLPAFDLFAVVVGADPRRLRSAIDFVYRDDRRDNEAAFDREEFSAGNYMEKIFQIPFVIPAMGVPEYAALVESFINTGNTGQEEAEHILTIDEIKNAPEGAGRRVSEPVRGNLFDELLEEKETAMMSIEGIPLSASGTPFDIGNASTSVNSTVAQSVPPAEAIRFDGRERGTMDGLAPLFRTPRLVKRFINTYRLLRTTIPDEAFTDFLQEEHAAAMVLLAVVINYPQLSGNLLGSLAAGGDKNIERSLLDMIKGLRCDATKSGPADKRQFDTAREEVLAGLHALKPELSTVRLPVRWVREAGRYTFQYS